MTQQLNSLGKSALLILSNTIIVLPFMIFIQIAKGTSLLALLPFLLFYTFRMTGIFFIRGIKTRINSYSSFKNFIVRWFIGLLTWISWFFLLSFLYFIRYFSRSKCSLVADVKHFSKLLSKKY
ncbi:hypothetical protein LLT6_14710 [Lactococcus cremoris subsp. cremoris TIFN6]|uniref:Uncharacterized protein n=1 Tax=Lactococcus cremoris subsp. cremoris TIFN6 TaxID=1234876 RepID=T0TFK1_LACLC|nr:hypothetical protein LLT6_14710 [Lactococcus cremoris subsp. cremoris TIFN6]